jgi:hypothetical protein
MALLAAGREGISRSYAQWVCGQDINLLDQFI